MGLAPPFTFTNNLTLPNQFMRSNEANGTRSALLQVSQYTTQCLHTYQVPRCRKWLKASCDDTLDNINCKAAMTFCEQSLSDPFFATGKYPSLLRSLIYRYKLSQDTILTTCRNCGTSPMYNKLILGLTWD